MEESGPTSAHSSKKSRTPKCTLVCVRGHRRPGSYDFRKACKFPHPCRGCKGGASRSKAGEPERWVPKRVSGSGRRLGKDWQVVRKLVGVTPLKVQVSPAVA